RPRISMDPDRRGDQDREDYAATVIGLYAELWLLAQTDEQRVILDREMHRFRDGYYQRVIAFHASYSRVVSSFIAGPSNFPVERMRKRGDAAHNRLNELIDYRKKAAEAVRRKVLAARPVEAVDAEEWGRLQRDVRRSLATIAGIDDGTERGYDRSAFANSIAGKVERLAKAGEVRLVERAVELVQAWQEERAKPAFTPRHKFWTFPALAGIVAAVQANAPAGEPETVGAVEALRILANPLVDRVQIVSDGIPPADLRARLKAEGWNWSRREGAWQRKLTDAVRAPTLRLTGAGKETAGV
uniref:hypothetical protein n=1 Tax=Paludisphaera soli TaxID=2712865 RepID=UPI0019810356